MVSRRHAGRPVCHRWPLAPRRATGLSRRHGAGPDAAFQRELGPADRRAGLLRRLLGRQRRIPEGGDEAAAGDAVGAVADICVIDPERPVTINSEGLSSKSKNTPFLGQTLAGRAVLTLVEGRAAFDLDARLR